MDLQAKAEEGEFEMCDCGCGRLTNVRKGTPVEERRFYVDGLQLLPECYEKVYGLKARKDSINNLLWLQNN